MKSILLSIGALCLFIVFLTPVSSCSKTTTVHDTTVRVVKDTVIIKDTVLIKDTSVDLKKGLIAYYNFNGGNLNDSSEMNNNIQTNTAVKTTDRFGRANNAYLFDGSSSYMIVKNSASLNPSTITLYATVKVNDFYTGPCGGNHIMQKGYPANINGFYEILFFDHSSNCGAINTSNESFMGTFGDNNPLGSAASAGNGDVKIVPGHWYHVAYTYDGTTSNFYIDGVLTDTRVFSAPFHSNSNDLYIGKQENPIMPFYFNGVMDEIRIYNRALKGCEITKLNTLAD